MTNTSTTTLSTMVFNSLLPRSNAAQACRLALQITTRRTTDAVLYEPRLGTISAGMLRAPCRRRRAIDHCSDRSTLFYPSAGELQA